MPDSNDVGKPTSPPDAANIPKQDERNTTVTDSLPRQPAEELPDLLTQAREFLSSPAIRPQSVSTKREFLLKKGLSPEQTEKLLEEADVCQSHLVRSLGLMAAGAAPTTDSSSNISTTAASFTASRTSCVSCEINWDFECRVRSRTLDLSCMSERKRHPDHGVYFPCGADILQLYLDSTQYFPVCRIRLPRDTH